MTVEKMYGSYSDADLNDWERFPMNAKVLTSSAFGAWLLRRDERRDRAITKVDYENYLKADMVAILTYIQREINKIPINNDNSEPFRLGQASAYDKCEDLIQQKINALKTEK